MSRELSKEIRAKAAPFVEWLQNAEEDSDEEDEDGEGNEDDGDIEVITHLIIILIYACDRNIYFFSGQQLA